ncbi:UNVERIFIED_CONTAM: hypothetical protein GTU68_024725 [Idotea baltica]|nr:hypothetical protein [Idotea baltica]
MSTMQIRALSSLVACLDCGEEISLGVRPTTKGMISEFTVSCKVCGSQKSTNTPNLIRERKRKREKKGVTLQKNENINYAHVAAYLDNGLGYSGLRHYCKYFNSRCLNEATFIVYAKQVIADVVSETEDFLQQNARIVRKAFESQHDADYIIDLTVGYTTTYHQWGSDFCLVAGAVIELQTGLVLDYDVGNMYCHVCKINAKKIVSMSPSEMTDWFNKHQDTCEIREWCDEIDQDSEEGIKEIDPKYLEAFIAKKIWVRSLEKFGFRYTTLIHESDERIHAELLKAAPYGDLPVIIDNITNCFSRRKSEHARTSFQNKLKAKCPRERVQTKDRIMYVYAMSIPEYNKFAIGSNIKLRELVRRMEIEEEEYQFATELTIQASEIIPVIEEQEMMQETKPVPVKDVGDAFEVEKDPEGDEQAEEEMEEGEEEEEEGEETVDEEEGPEYELINSQDIEVLEEEVEDDDNEEDEEMEVDAEGEVEAEVDEQEPLVGSNEKEKILKKEANPASIVTVTAAKENNVEVSEKLVTKVSMPSQKDAGSTSKTNSSDIEKAPPPLPSVPNKSTALSGAKPVPKHNPKPVSEAGIVKKTPLMLESRPATGEVRAIGSGEGKAAATTLEKKSVTVKVPADPALEKKVQPTLANKPSPETKVIIASGKKLPVSSEPKTNAPGISIEHKKIVVVTGKKPVVQDPKGSLPLKKIVATEGPKKDEIRKIVTSTANEIRKSFSAVEIRKGEEQKVKNVIVETREPSGSGSAARKDATSSGSEKAKELPRTGKPASENGMEQAKARQPKQPEVVKPFRVDFDED